MCFEPVGFESPTIRFLGFPNSGCYIFLTPSSIGFPELFVEGFDGDITFRFLDLC